MESEVVKIELNSPAKHNTAEKKSPNLVVICDTGLKFGKEGKLNTVPLFNVTEVVH